MNPTRIHEDMDLIPGPTQYVKDLATAAIQPLAWELPYATGTAIKRQKIKKTKKKNVAAICSKGCSTYVFL